MLKLTTIPGQNDFTLVELYAPLITKYVSVCGTKGEKSIKLIENKSNFSCEKLNHSCITEGEGEGGGGVGRHDDLVVGTLYARLASESPVSRIFSHSF